MNENNQVATPTTISIPTQIQTMLMQAAEEKKRISGSHFFSAFSWALSADTSFTKEKSAWAYCTSLPQDFAASVY